MNEGKVRKLSGVVSQYAPEGANDGRWFLLEHQLYQARVSAQTARQLCEAIGEQPENEEERELASSTLELLTPLFIATLKALAEVKSLLSDTEIAERIGAKEE